MHSRFYIYVDLQQNGVKDVSVPEDMDRSVPKVGFTSKEYPIPMNFIGKIKQLRYYPSAIYKQLAENGKFVFVES